MKRVMKAAIIGVIKLSLAIGLGVCSLIIGEVGWACILFIVAVFMGVDCYRSYNKEEKAPNDIYDKIETRREIIDHYAHNGYHGSMDHDDNDVPDAPDMNND